MWCNYGYFALIFSFFSLAKHLHEASRRVMQKNNDEIEPLEELHEVTDSLHYDRQGWNTAVVLKFIDTDVESPQRTHVNFFMNFNEFGYD